MAWGGGGGVGGVDVECGHGWGRRVGWMVGVGGGLCVFDEECGHGWGRDLMGAFFLFFFPLRGFDSSHHFSFAPISLSQPVL